MESNERDKGKVVGEKEAKQADQNTDSDKKDPLKMGTLELTGWWAGQATDEEVAALSGRQICRMTYQMINDECTPLPLPHALKRIIYEMTEERRENDPEMTVKDWVWLVCLLAECSPSVPKDVLDGWFDRKKGKNEDKEEKPIPPKPKSRRDPDQQICPMTAMLPRLNKIHMTESDLFTKVVCKFWPPDAIDAAVKKLRHGAFDTSLYKTGLSEAEYPLVFFSIDWTVTRISYDANSAIAMVATSLACIATAIEKCSDEELSKVIRMYCDVSERTTYTFQAALISDEEPIKLILTAHRKLLMDARKRKKVLIEIANLNFKTAIFLKISPFLQVEILGETMWQVVKDLVEEFLKDVNEQQNPPSALAIPEYDEDDEDLGETEWIDQIIRRVPAALDERNAKKSEMGNHLQKLTRLIIHYIELGKIAKSGHQMLSLIERFYLKICSDADCPSLIEHMEKTYAELCRRNLVPLDMQERILSDLLGEELMNSSRTNFCDLVTTLIGFAHQDSRPKLAQLVLDKYFEDLAVKRIKMNMASLHIERTVIRFVGKEYAAKMARNIIYFLAPKELGDDETELSYKLLLVIFDSLISGGGENSCRLECFNLIGLTGVRCTCSERKFDHKEEPWKLSLSDLDLKDAVWEEFCEAICRRCAHSSIDASVLVYFPKVFIEQPTFEHLLFTSQLLRDFQKSTVRLQYMEFYGHTPEAQNTANDLAMRHVIVKQITDCIDGMETALRKGTWREHERAMSTTISSWMSAILADNKPIRAPLMQFTKDIVNQIVIETAGQSHPSAACLIGTTTAPFDRLCAFTQIDHGAIIHEIIRDKRIEEFEAFYGLDAGILENIRIEGNCTQLKHLYSLITESLLKTFDEDELKANWRHADTTIPMEDSPHFWLTSVLCTRIHRGVASPLEETALKTMYSQSNERVSSIFVDYALHHLLKTMFVSVPPQKFEPLSMRDFFASLFFQIINVVVNEKRTIPKADEDTIVAMFKDSISKCETADRETSGRTYSITESFITYFTAFLTASSPDCPLILSLRDRFAQIVAEELKEHLHVWIENADCRTSLLNSSQPLFDYLTAKGLITEKSIQSELKVCQPLIFNDEIGASVARSIQIQVQSTDKSFMSTLNWKTLIPTLVQEEITNEDDKKLYPIREFAVQQRHIEGNEHFLTAIRLFCKYADADMQFKLLEFATNYLVTHLSVNDNILKAISGERPVEHADHPQIFELMLQFALMEYVNGVLARATKNKPKEQENDQPGYFSDSEYIKASIVRKGSAASVSSAMRRAVQNSSTSVASTNASFSSSVSRASNTALQSSTSASGLLPLCTYSTTQEEFVNQHWYNCYTCNMVDTVGVCTVCAVNCHRGHDLSYSKRGSFFCDCGHAKCASMTSTAHAPNATNASMGRTPPLHSPPQTVAPLPNDFVFHQEMQLDWTKIEPFAKIIGELLMTKGGDCMQRLAAACQKGNNLRWKIDEKRQAQLNAIRATHPMQIETDGPAIMEAIDLKMDLKMLIDAKSPAQLVNASTTSISTGGQAQNAANQVGENSTPAADRSRARDMSVVVRLSELAFVWLMVSDGGTTLQIIMPQWSTDLAESLQNARVTTEQLGFVGYRIAASGRKIAISGQNDVLIATINDEGELIEKYSIKINDVIPLGAPPIHVTNQVIKCVWAHTKTQSFVAVVTMQFVRVYDPMQDTTNFVEEMVLPLGNIEDVQLVVMQKKKNERGQNDENMPQTVWALILSSTGLFYEHEIVNSRASNMSYFLTNTIACLPAPNSQMPGHGGSISLFYSEAYNTVFISFEKATMVAAFPEDPSVEEHWKWTKIALPWPVSCWQESSGVITCLNYPQANHLISMSFSENGKLNVQSTNLYRSAFGHQIYTPTTRHTVVSLTFFQDMPTIMAHQLVWRQLTDLWIDGCPLVSHKIVEINEENVADQLAKEDLIPMMEKCEPITRTEITSQILQQHYSTEDLHTRFNTIGASPVVAIQAEEFDVMIRVVEPVVVRAIRIEVPASNYPQEMVIPAINRTVFIFTNVKRFYDICLTRQESMLLENRAIRLTFRHRQPATQHTITIISLRLFGVSSKEFGAMRTQRFCRPPASLPDQIVRAYLYLISKLIAEKSIEADKGKLHKLSEQQLSLKSSHCDVIAAAKHLLRAVTKDRIEYYMFKDKYLIAELKQFDVIGFRLPHDLVLPVIVQLKMAMYTRWKVIDGLIHSVFGSPVAFVQMLCRQLDTCQFTTSLTCLISILEVVIATIFVYVSQNDKNTEKLVSIYFDLFGKSKNPLVAQKIRHLTQVMVYSCSVAARDDRILYKAFKESKQLSLLKFAALRPFYEKARLLTPDDNKADVEQLMGELMNDDDEGVENRDLSWMNYLLTAILHKVNSEININSGLLLGKNDSSSMILIAIVIMSNLNPPKLQPHIEQMVRCIDWTQAKGDDTKVPLVEINDVNYRRLLFLRIISVLISKFTDRLDPKKKIDIVDGRATSVEADYLDENASLTSVSTQTSSTQLDEQSSRKKQIQKMLENIAQLLLENDALDFFLKIALHVAPIWKQGKVSQIRRQQVEANAQNLAARNIIPEQTLEEEHEKISTHYMQLLTDVALKIPAQLKKIKKDLEFDAKWQKVVCEMQSMRNYPSLVKYSKKLLHAICDGDREKCRVMRDAYKMIQQLETLKRKYANLNGHQHEQLTDMVELVGSLNALAAQRLATWKSIAERNINWLLQVACRTVDALASSIIELLLLAIRHTDEGQEQLADHLIADPDNRSLLRLLVLRYLIGREPEHRWLLHKMLRSTIQLANRQNQLLLIRLLLDLWPTARSVGIQGAQLADLIASYAYRLLNSNELATLCQTELVAIGNIMQRMTADGHFETHKEMSTNALGWKSLLLETSPCLSCYSLRSASECHKLMSIKHDVRFSSNAMMFKLASHYEISKLTIRLNDVKRGKSIKKVVVYYCAKNVESAVELKTHRELWQKIANVSVEQNETEINLQLAIPVVTSSLVVQFAELYESRTPPTELHCPRCSTLVTSNPGVCEHCGENVYQCMKCRAINYDEREPFLCQGCGFCKYARIDISAICRQIAGVQPITSDAERAQCVSEMSRLLVTIEQTRAQLKAQRLLLESLWLKCRPLPTVHLKLESPNVAETIVGPHNMTFVPVNFYQPPVAALHSALNNCHLTNQELCIQTQQLIAQREQLRIYDKTDASPELLHESFNQGYYSTSSHCFGCQSAGIIHSLCLVRSACDDTAVLNSLVESDNVFNLLTRLYQFEPMAEEIRELFVLLATTTKEGNRRLCEMVFEGKLPTTLLGKCILTDEDAFWEEKFKVLVKCAVSRNDPSSSTYAFWMMEKLLKEAVFLRSAIFHKMQEENDDKMLEKTARSNDLPPHVLTTNALLDSPQNFVKWLLIDDDEAESKKFHLAYEKWLKSSMFSPHASLRAAACNFLVTAARHPGHSGIVLHLVLTCLPLSCKTSSHLCGEFLQAVHRVFSLSTSIKVRLFLNGAHKWLIEAVNRECRLIYEEEQNETSTSHWFGDNLCHYTQLLVVLLTGSTVENLLMKTAIRHLLKPLLQSTVLLKRVVLRRTRSIDTAKNALETLLKRLSARDPLVLIKAAVESIGAFEEMTTHAHVISIILDVMDPEQTEEEDFLIQIEKDAAQEDFLQGRMSGNPYKSTDAGMGPLMRDVKNRICRDTEMIALLEDDNGMELLVNNYIISLSLPVRQVYEKMWKKQHPGQAMVIVYRMRGLLGDAQETFISSFGETAEEEQMEDEKLNEALSCLVECGGLDVALQLLVKADRSTWGRQLLSQLRKLMDKCAKTRFGRTQLIERDGLSHFLKIFRLCIEPDPTDEHCVQLAKSYMELCNVIVKDEQVHKLLKGITKSEAEWLIKLVLNKELTEKAWTQQFSRGATELVELCLATLGSLILGNDEAEAALCSHCKLDADKLAEVDNDYSPQKEALQTELDRLATVAQAIPRSPAGCRLKDQILATGIVAKACKQIVDNHPPLYSATESPEWKAFVAKPSISLILKILHGLTKGHEPTQKAMADKNTLAILHRLEQVASENSIGTLAENVVEALKENEEVAAQIEKVREETKKKRKEMAMAMRMKQLSKLGMQVGKQGEVKVTSRKVVSEPLVDDVSDPLAVCCICRENLFTGKKAAAVYAFCSLTDSRIHYSVSQMVMVHIDCHSNAIKRGVGGRSVDEWAKAALHNAGVRCNMLTPLAIGNAPNAEWLTAVEKMRKNIEDALQIPPHFNRQFFYNDMCQIVDRFVFRRSFSEQAQGGGRESNVQYLAVLHLLCISFPPDDTSLTSNEPRHRLVSFLLTEQSLKSWEEQSQDILNASLRDGEDPAHPRNFADLKPLCLTWAFVDTYFKTVIPIPEDVERDEWLKARLLETLHKTAEFVKTFDEMILPIETWGEFIDYFNLPSDEFGDYFDQAPPPADDAQQI